MMSRPVAVVTFVRPGCRPLRIYCNGFKHVERVSHYPLGTALVSTFDYSSQMWIVIGSKRPNKQLTWIPQALDIVEAGTRGI